MKYYSYIFIRQDLSLEQQIIQSAHVALNVGYVMAKLKPFDRMNHTTGTVAYSVDPYNVHYVLVGVRNVAGLNAVMKILCKFGYEYRSFHEPDIGQDTAVMTLPISEFDRDVLQAFNTLKV